MMMQSTSELFTALSGQGITISLVGDKLKVEPRHLVTEEVKEIVAQHKAEIVESLRAEVGVIPAAEGNPWDWLRPISDRQPCYAGKDQGPSCFSCKSYDGRGASWPGRCRVPESIGRVSLEIDWNVVDPVHGCGCYEPDAKRITARDKEPGFCLNDSPLEESTGGPSCDDKPVARPIPCREKISPVALSWLREQRQALKAAGWTMRELYRRNRSKGLAWSGIWDQPLLKVYLHDSGIIEFESVIAGKDIIQKARPMPQRKFNKGV
jgi:hypothetical protein